MTEEKEIFEAATEVTEFANYTEKIPGTSVSFEMIAIPAGSFTIGNSKGEPMSEPDEVPPVKVNMSKFWMGKAEVSWDEFLAFFAETNSQGHAIV